MKYVTREGEKRPGVSEMLTNKLVGQLKLSDGEWAQASKGMDEFRGLLS
jgi:hypothetical protein